MSNQADNVGENQEANLAEAHARIEKARQEVLSDGERSGLLALHSLLRTVDPHHARLGLQRVPTYTGDFLWLCRTHYELSQPRIPETIG